MENAKLFTTRKVEPAYDYRAPDGSEIRLLTDVPGGGLAHARLPAGGVSIAIHHQTVDEIWFFISGSGEVWRKLDDTEEVTSVQAGVSLNIPVGASFQFRNTGDEPLDFLVVTIPRWPGAHEAIPVSGKWER